MTAVLLIMVVGALSVLMLGVVVAQVQPTMFAAKNSRTIVAAEAGVDAALSQMRSATAVHAISHQVLGDPSKLPCTVQGQVNGVSTDYSYKVQVTYFDEDPKGRSAAWRSTNALTCGATGLSAAPSFAVITSEGLDSGVPGLASTAGDRKLETVYTFQVTNNNIEGGAIYSFGVATCLQADGQTVGSTITYVSAEQCRTDDPRRLWSWKDDYGIHLAVTDLAGSTPLCITGRPSSGAVNATLQVCNGASNQLFSWHGGALFKVQNAGNTNYSGFCLGTGAASKSVPLGLKLAVGDCGNNIAWSSFDPDARVGAAKASATTNQIVNFLEFGRCFDVTQQQVGKAFMIVYPCKQDPSPAGGLLDWNHEWYYIEPPNQKGSKGAQQIYVNQEKNTTKKYCLKTPSTTASPAYVTLTTTCSGDDVTWTRDADTGVYAESWRFRDRYDRCISIGPKPPYDPAAPDLVNWSTIVVAACSGEPAQKWNAPPTAQNASLDNYRELSN
ncbi:hypothetical protein [Sanguibacter suarezii]|uniref:hypothetical protein n=1 Tax=Sanguibacter suarezii TaxID=60921 RepID=UPI000A431ECA|nr:hypothetical protein [Sanguibacter suarezii]